MNAFAHYLRAQYTIIQFIYLFIYFIWNSQPFVFCFAWHSFFEFVFFLFFVFELEENQINRSLDVHAISTYGQFVERSHDVPLWMNDFYDPFFKRCYFFRSSFLFFSKNLIKFWHYYSLNFRGILLFYFIRNRIHSIKFCEYCERNGHMFNRFCMFFFQMSSSF